jgi:short-subunit dehydrogenase
VTGSTDGIGQHTATLLAKDGAHVLLHGRSAARLAATKARILQACPDAQLTTFQYDLSDVAETKRFCNDVLRTTTQLDGLVQNAGVFEETFQTTKDGLEMTFAVNVAAPYIAALLLLPLLRATPQSRILNVSSISQGGKIELDNLQFEKGGFNAHKAYSLSKLHMAAFSAELARKITPDDDALVYSCDPGTVNTKMLLAGWGECGIDVSNANDEYTLITRPFDPAAHGEYYVGCRKSVTARDVKDDSLRAGLWRELERITGVSI